MTTPSLPVFRACPKSFPAESAAHLNSCRPRFACAYPSGVVIDVTGNPHYEKLVAAHQLRVDAKMTNHEVIKHPLLPIKCVTTYEIEMAEAESRQIREAQWSNAGISDLQYDRQKMTPLPLPKKGGHLKLVKSL